MKEHLGFLVFRVGLLTAYAWVLSLPNTLSPGGPGHGPEGININTRTHSIPLCVFTFKLFRRHSTESKFFPAFIFPSSSFSFSLFSSKGWSSGRKAYGVYSLQLKECKKLIPSNRDWLHPHVDGMRPELKWLDQSKKNSVETQKIGTNRLPDS